MAEKNTLGGWTLKENDEGGKRIEIMSLDLKIEKDSRETEVAKIMTGVKYISDLVEDNYDIFSIGLKEKSKGNLFYLVRDIIMNGGTLYCNKKGNLEKIKIPNSKKKELEPYFNWMKEHNKQYKE